MSRQSQQPTIDAIRTACPTLAALLPGSELAQLVSILSATPVSQTYRLCEAARLFKKSSVTLWRWARNDGGVFVPGRDHHGEPVYTSQQVELMAAVISGEKSKSDADTEWSLMAQVRGKQVVERKRKTYSRTGERHASQTS